MLDVIYIGTMVLIFMVGELYAHWCEKL